LTDLAVVPARLHPTTAPARRSFERRFSAMMRAFGSPKTPRTVGCARKPANEYVSHSRRWRFDARAIRNSCQISQPSKCKIPLQSPLFLRFQPKKSPTRFHEDPIHIAAAMTRNNEASQCEGTLVTVDVIDVNDSPDAPWKLAGLAHSPRDNIARLGMTGSVEFITAESLSYFDSHAEQFDFVFLDGDHAASTVYQELPRALKHPRGGGAILMHDFFPHQRRYGAMAG
jgi:hypothetical protein